MHSQDTYAWEGSSQADRIDPDGYPTSSGHDAGTTGSKPAAVVDTAREKATDEATVLARTAKREAGGVVDEARSQVRRLASEAREQAGTRVRGQHDRVVRQLRGLADEFTEMAGDGNTPARAVVGDLGTRGRRVADYLADRGPEGVLSEVQNFARNRPLAFLAAATAAGLLVGRLGRGAWKARSDGGPVSTQTVLTDPTEPYRGGDPQ
jgi:hypothetical protein